MFYFRIIRHFQLSEPSVVLMNTSSLQTLNRYNCRSLNNYAASPLSLNKAAVNLVAGSSSPGKYGAGSWACAVRAGACAFTPLAHRTPVYWFLAICRNERGGEHVSGAENVCCCGRLKETDRATTDYTSNKRRGNPHVNDFWNIVTEHMFTQE